MNILTSFKGKTALVTGASSGIGMGFARTLAANGIDLVITARSEMKLQDLAQELKTAYGINIYVIILDLAEANAVYKLTEYLRKNRITVDILINNAGFGKWAKFLDEPLTSYHQMLALNINSLVTLTYLLLPAMLEKKQGLIINVASTAAFQPLPYIAIYGASKTFVLNFTEAIAGENLDSGVKFLALCPGNTATNFAQVANADTDGMPVSTVETVVDAAIRALGRNQLYCIPGKRNYFSAQFARIIPRFIMLKIVENMFRKRVVKEFF